jgi:hypothetical protein
MLTRWTIYTLAEEIEAQFKGADPESKLLRKFDREGRKHGKRGMSPEPMRHFLENAIEIATSKIAEDFLDEEKAVAANLAGMRARKMMIEEDLEEAGNEDSPAAPEIPTGGSESGLGTGTAGPDLNASLSRLKAVRAAREAADREAKRRAELAQIEDELDGLQLQIAVVEQTLADLPEKYRQLVESCHETGELMWTSYRLGFQRGTARRGVPDATDEGPEPEIEFEYPEVLEHEVDARDTTVIGDSAEEA